MSEEREGSPPLTGTDALIALLPWYDEGGLSAEDRLRVEEALAQDRALQEALTLVREERAALATPEAALPPAPVDAFDRVLAKIEADGTIDTATTLPDVPDRLQSLRLAKDKLHRWAANWEPQHFQMAGVAAALVIFLQTGVIAYLVGAKDPMQQTVEFETASEGPGTNGSQSTAFVTPNGPPKDGSEDAAPSETGPAFETASAEPGLDDEGPRALVQFKPETPLGEVIDILTAVDARIVGGPSASGFLTIALPPAPETPEDREAAEAIFAGLKSAHPSLVFLQRIEE
ncbi:MAG: hypothetical protein AAGH45_07925 [Pseudomonadota bacterium]